MKIEKNMEKYEAYKKMHDDLNKAMKNEFYLQAIFLEYAIFEDRLLSVIIHAGMPPKNKDGKDYKITRKIDIIKDRNEFQTKYIRSRLDPALMEKLREWTKRRNDLIHGLANMPYNSDDIRSVAEDGFELLKIVKSRSQSVINYFKKNNMTE